ncbi:MAG: hypothetical protein JKY84_01970 [Emcibacteraceae bacterium]|nr:hypothetical protein [Emcibacteraceae bacterium]
MIINQLNASTSHAQQSIIELRNVVSEEGQKLDQKLRKASEMADELDMINETGSNLADRIEQGLTGNKKKQNTNSPQQGNISSAEKADISNEKISLSDLDNEESNAGGDDSLLESLRNVR